MYGGGGAPPASGGGFAPSSGAVSDGSLGAAGASFDGGASTGMRGLGLGAMNARDAEVHRAMNDLESLQGLVSSDSRDAWRFEQAARPTTAPGVWRGGGDASGGAGAAATAGGVHGAPQVLQIGSSSSGVGGDEPASSLLDASSSLQGRPSTSGGAAVEPETEAELRLRLASAESVMRKLYRKTNDLEERLSMSKAEQGSPSSRGGGGTGSVSASSPGGRSGGGEGSSGDGGQGGEADGGGGGGGGGGALTTPAEREQALYLLQQKEADLQRMREYTSQLASRIEHMAAEQQKLTQARPSTAMNPDARNDEYRERYMRMRGEYRQLLRSRTDSVRRSGRIAQAGEHGVLIEQLDAALKEEAELHRKESQRLNEELYLQEKRSCDWYAWGRRGRGAEKRPRLNAATDEGPTTTSAPPPPRPPL